MIRRDGGLIKGQENFIHVTLLVETLVEATTHLQSVPALSLRLITFRAFQLQWNCAYSDDGYPDRLGPSGKFIENCIKLTGLGRPG